MAVSTSQHARTDLSASNAFRETGFQVKLLDQRKREIGAINTETDRTVSSFSLIVSRYSVGFASERDWRYSRNCDTVEIVIMHTVKMHISENA